MEEMPKKHSKVMCRLEDSFQWAGMVMEIYKFPFLLFITFLLFISFSCNLFYMWASMVMGIYYGEFGNCF